MDDKLQMEIRRALPQPDPALNADPELNRAAGKVVFDLYSGLITLCMESGAATARWLLTVLVAINGGAAVAVGGAALPSAYKVAACAAFVAGIVSALGASLSVLIALPAMMKPIGSAVGYWLTVQVDGERIDDDMKHQDEEMTAAARKAAIWPMALAVLSVVLFVGGVVVAGVGLL